MISRQEDGSITISVDDTNLMKTSKYASTENDGCVKLADEAIGIKNVKLQLLSKRKKILVILLRIKCYFLLNLLYAV